MMREREKKYARRLSLQEKIFLRQKKKTRKENLYIGTDIAVFT